MKLAGTVTVAALTVAALTVAAVTAACTASGQHSRLRPLPEGVRGVAVQSSRNAWSVGSPPADVRPQKAIVAHWNGEAWTTFSPRGLPQRSGLGAVAAFPGGAWAVGDYGTTQHGDGGGRPRQFIVRLTGTTMRRVPVPEPADGGLVDVAATSTVNAWAVGYLGGVDLNDGIPLILHWNGTAWTRARLPAALGRGYFAGVTATSATNAWAVTNTGKIVHWNGLRWDHVVSPVIGVTYQLHDVATTSARNVWAVGGAGSKRTVILHWNGLRWTWDLSPKIRGRYSFRGLYAVSASSADDALAVGSADEGTLALHWNGHGWKRFKTPGRGGLNSLEDVTFIPRSGRAWAVDVTGSATLIFEWDGTSWR